MLVFSQEAVPTSSSRPHSRPNRKLTTTNSNTQTTSIAIVAVTVEVAAPTFKPKSLNKPLALSTKAHSTRETIMHSRRASRVNHTVRSLVREALTSTQTTHWSNDSLQRHETDTTPAIWQTGPIARRIITNFLSHRSMQCLTNHSVLSSLRRTMAAWCRRLHRITVDWAWLQRMMHPLRLITCTHRIALRCNSQWLQVEAVTPIWQSNNPSSNRSKLQHTSRCLNVWRAVSVVPLTSSKEALSHPIWKHLRMPSISWVTVDTVLGLIHTLVEVGEVLMGNHSHLITLGREVALGIHQWAAIYRLEDSRSIEEGRTRVIVCWWLRQRRKLMQCQWINQACSLDEL